MRPRASAPPLSADVLSDVGQVRAANEDAFAIVPDRGLLIVSDGMGDHQAGATAAEIVVSVLPRMIAPSSAPSRMLRDAIVKLSRQVREQSVGRAGLSGMGATVVVALLRRDKAFVAHMGDSRAYLFRKRQLELLTEDHSLVHLLLRRGEITPDEAKDHPLRGKLSRYVGMEADTYPDVRRLRLHPGDRLLLCSDGLTGMVPDERIATILGTSGPPLAACQSLIDAANANGGRDNITALVADYSGG